MSISDEAAGAAEEVCPIAYDHVDNLEECAVCGWRIEERPKTRGPRDIAPLNGPERIQEAIDRLSGAYAPQHRIMFMCRPDEAP